MNRSASAGREELRAIARRAIAARGLLPDFSPAVLAEAAALAERFVETGPAIHDLRDLAWASIDNDDTRDLDQLQVVEPLAGGAVKLLVAMADVDATVAEGSAIDGHARANTTSVYTAAEIFPRLPEKLSTDLTSLGEARDRLAIVVEMAVGPDGAVTDYTHSTAPNRRFPDLATQRLIEAAIAGNAAPHTAEQLTDLARHCTSQEDDAAKVERQVRKSAAALLLAPRVGQRFDAIVTGASPKGTWVRIPHPAVEGRVVRGEHGLDVGDRARVELVHTDVERGFIDFARA